MEVGVQDKGFLMKGIHGRTEMQKREDGWKEVGANTCQAKDNKKGSKTDHSSLTGTRG